MIHLTNKYNLPDSIVRACLVDKHVVKGDISVTQLIDAPQIRMLRKKHDIEEDVMDRIYALMGTAVHHVIERAEMTVTEARKLMEASEVLMEHNQEKAAKFMVDFAKKTFPDAFTSNVMIEKTLSVTIDDVEISGTMDRFDPDTGILEDYKNTSVYSYIFEESKKKWSAQQNIYAFMLREHGYKVEKAQIVAIFRDWSRAASKRQKDYPPHQVMTIPIKLVEHEKMKEYIRKRVRLHEQAENGDIPDCTGKEKWSKADSFAVRKKGSKKALRVFDRRPLAENFIETNWSKYEGMYIEHRPGENGRCERFCSVSAVCPQYKREQKALAELTGDSNIES